MVTFFGGFLIVLSALLLSGWFQTAFPGLILAFALLFAGSLAAIHYSSWLLLLVTFASLWIVRLTGLEPSFHEIVSRTGRQMKDKVWIQKLINEGRSRYVYLPSVLGSGLIAGWITGLGFWNICYSVGMPYGFVPPALFATLIAVFAATMKFFVSRRRWNEILKFEI